MSFKAEDKETPVERGLRKISVKESGSQKEADIETFDPPSEGGRRELWLYIQALIRFNIRSPLELGRLEDIMTTLIFAQTDPSRPIRHRHKIRQFLKKPPPVKSDDQMQYRSPWSKDMSLMEIKSLARTQAGLVFESYKGEFPHGMLQELPAAIEWWLQNYALVKFYRDRHVDLQQVKGGNIVTSGSGNKALSKLTRGWRIIARKDIPYGNYIYELTAICATVEGDHGGLITRISIIRLPSGTEHVLAGPLRFLNHDCKDSNAAYVYLQHVPGAHAVQATRNIKAGEEILVFYGDDYFADLKECVCRSCREQRAR